MSFASLTFLVFLLGLMLVYFLVPGRARWGVLLAGSYAFIRPYICSWPRRRRFWRR